MRPRFKDSEQDGGWGETSEAWTGSQGSEPTLPGKDKNPSLTLADPPSFKVLLKSFAKRPVFASDLPTTTLCRSAQAQTAHSSVHSPGNTCPAQQVGSGTNPLYFQVYRCCLFTSPDTPCPPSAQSRITLFILFLPKCFPSARGSGIQLCH